MLDLSEANVNLGEHQFSGMEAIRPILDFRRLIHRDTINYPHLRQDDIKSGEINIKRNKNNNGHILIEINRRL